MTVDLPLVWAALIAFAILAYVVLDGFDLGLGILFPFFRDEDDRDRMTNSVAPVWDGNETWLVLGGGGLLAAFPLAYAIVLPALYAPLTAMLLALIFRGVAFEFRWRTRKKAKWDFAFATGSIVGTLCQGIALGAFLQGIRIEGRAYGGGWFDWLTPFTLLTGAALVAGYALLGAGWLVIKTEGDLQARAYRAARFAGVATLAFIAVVSLATPLLGPLYWQRWFSWPEVLYTAPVPVLVVLTASWLFWGIRNRRERVPFFAGLGLFLLSYIGLGISIYPYAVPPSLTIWEAAAPDESLGFLLVGAAILVPMILAYTAHAYWVFRGKVTAEGGYH